MATGLLRGVTAASGLRELFVLLDGLPSLGPFLAYRHAIDVC
jgi:hypothetical protein